MDTHSDYLPSDESVMSETGSEAGLDFDRSPEVPDASPHEKSKITAPLPDVAEDGDFHDMAQLDYELIFKEVISIAPGMKLLIESIANIRPPQRGEAALLFEQVRAGDPEAEPRLQEMYLRQVVKQALFCSKLTGLCVEDLFQEGFLGLQAAIRKFNPNIHHHLTSYVSLWVKQHMDRAVANYGRPIRLPVHVLEKLTQYEQIRSDLCTSGKPSHADAIAKQMGVELEIIEQFESYENLQPESLLDYFEADDDDFLSCVLLDPHSECMFDEVDVKYYRHVMDTLFSELLRDRESDVIIKRFGLDGSKPATLDVIGRQYSVTRERIRQIETRALRRLRCPKSKAAFRNCIELLQVFRLSRNLWAGCFLKKLKREQD